MFKVVVTILNLSGQSIEISSQLFDDAALAQSEALRHVEAMPEIAGVLSWEVSLTDCHTEVVESWTMDDCQSEFPHRQLVRDNWDGMFFISAKRSSRS